MSDNIPQISDRVSATPDVTDGNRTPNKPLGDNRELCDRAPSTDGIIRESHHEAMFGSLLLYDKRERAFTDPTQRKNAPHGNVLLPPRRMRYTSECSVDDVTPINASQNIFFAPTRVDSVTADKEISGSPDDPVSPERGSVAPDGGYGWVIVAAAFGCACSLGFVFTGFSVLYTDITEHFQTTKGATGLIGSLYLCTGNFLGFLFTPVIRRYGCRVVCCIGAGLASTGFVLSSLMFSVQYLYFTYGVIAGLGNGLLILTCIVVVQPYFNRKRTMAFGIAASGLSCGSLAAGPTLRWLLDVYGLSGTFLLVGGIFLQNFVVGALYRPLARQKKVYVAHSGKENIADTHKELPEVAQNGGTAFPVKKCGGRLETVKRFLKEVFDLSLLKDPRSPLMYVGSTLTQFGIMVLFPHSFSRAVSIGIEGHMAALVVAIFAVCTLCGRIACSLLAMRIPLQRTLQYAIAVVVMATTIMLLPLTTSFVSMVLVGGIAAAAGGVILTLQTPVLVDLFGVETIARSQAFQNMFCGIGILFAVPFGGFLYDISQSYTLPYLVCGGIQLLSAFIIFAMYCISRKGAPPTKQSRPEEAGA